MTVYRFKNVNPLGKIEEDCVCRAIKNALDLDYYEVKEKLNLIGKLFDCDSLCVCCYKFLLDYVFNLKRDETYKGWKIKDFARDNPNGIFIVRTEGHLTSVVNGYIEDTWDCGDRIVDIVWSVKE